GAGRGHTRGARSRTCRCSSDRPSRRASCPRAGRADRLDRSTWPYSLFAFRDQTRRRLGGRQPLWGMGVRSRMRLIFNPVAASARSADSRPEPGPLMNTLIDFMPCSIALWAASSAANWAANGVDLREPLKPFTPAEDQATTF